MSVWFRQFRGRAAGFFRDAGAAAAVETALVVSLLTIPLLNITDLGIYAYRRMQVENAAQMGAQAAWSSCNTAAAFASSCSGLAATATTAVQNTSLGTGVTLASGSPAEGYYCTTTSGALSLVATPPAGPPADCSGVSGASNPSKPPGDYIQVSVTYSFTSPFSDVSVTSLLPSPITKTTWTRVL